MQSWLLSLLPVANLGFAALSFSHPSLALPDPGPSSPLRCSQLLVRAGWAVISAVTLLFLFFLFKLENNNSSAAKLLPSSHLSLSVMKARCL